MDKTVCLDRKLITGSSPLASNELGKLAVKTLLNEIFNEVIPVFLISLSKRFCKN